MTDRGPRKTIYILESDAELGQLMASVLAGAGYNVSHGVPDLDATKPFGSQVPDLLVVGLVPGRDVEGTILAALRDNHHVNEIPVLAVTPAEHLASGALAGYSARETLQMPFDLDEFLTKVEESLGLSHSPARAATQPEPSDLAVLSARVLAAQSRAAVFRWVQQLRQESPWRERTDLKLYEIIDGVPVLVEALVAALQAGDPEEPFASSPKHLARVREHAELRRCQGFPLVKVIREYSILRDELLRILWEHLPRLVPSDEVLVVSRAFNLSLDRITEQTVAHYLAEGLEAPLPQQQTP